MWRSKNLGSTKTNRSFEEEWWDAKYAAIHNLIFDPRNATSEELEKVARLATQELNALKAARSS